VAKAIEFIPKIRKTAVQEAEASGLKNPVAVFDDRVGVDMVRIQVPIESANANVSLMGVVRKI